MRRNIAGFRFVKSIRSHSARSPAARLLAASLPAALLLAGLLLSASSVEAQDAQDFLVLADDVADSRRTAGVALLSWGLAGVLTGGAVLTIDALDGGLGEAGLASGVTHASFGAINGLLALGLVGTKAAAAEHDPLELSQNELRSGQVFALNLGLDVAYIAAGVLLGLGGVELDKPWMEGAGWAMTAQGAGLLVFDIWQWIASNDRAAAWKALHQRKRDTLVRKPPLR